MAIQSVYCRVLQGHVTVVADLEGGVTRVVCPHYQEPSGVCQLKRDAETGGPLSNFLDRVSEATLDQRSVRCHLGV